MARGLKREKTRTDMMLQHCLRDGQQLAYAGREGPLVGFVCKWQARLGATGDRVALSCDQYSHAKLGANAGAATPHSLSGPPDTTAMVERGHDHWCGDRFGGPFTQFWQVGQGDKGQLKADVRNRAQEVFLLVL